MTREPWTIDATLYNATFGSLEQDRPPRYGSKEHLIAMGKWRDDERTTRPQSKTKSKWDSSPHRPVPYALRGLKPATTATDPWVADLKFRNADFENTDVIEDDNVLTRVDGSGPRFKKYTNPPGKIGGREVAPWNPSTVPAPRIRRK